MSSLGPIKIDPLSVTSLYLKLCVNHGEKIQLSTATGFVVQHKARNFLVTNWHVFSGRNAETEQLMSTTGGLPDEVRIAHNIRGKLGHWRFHGEPLLTEDRAPRWVEHPRGRAVDVACLELQNLPDDIELIPMDLALEHTDILAYPGMAVSVIGFPLGLRPNWFCAVWKTGHIASDPDLARLEHAWFLIDATTREGMSGSPVVIRSSGAHMTSQGYSIAGGTSTRFLGIYSGRIHKDAEVGRVWHPRVIHELLERATG